MPKAERETPVVSRVADGHYRVAGDLDFATVPGLWAGIEPLIGPEPELTLSLDGVGRANSAGLALMMEALELARQRKVRLHFEAVTPDLQSLAGLSGVAGLLG